MRTEVEKMDIEIYYSDDGKRFTLKSHCENYERSLKDRETVKSIAELEIKFELFSDSIGSTFYMVGNEDQKEYLYRKYMCHNQYERLKTLHKSQKLQKGDWVAVEYEFDSFGERSVYGLVTLEYILDKMTKFIEKANELTIDGKY